MTTHTPSPETKSAQVDSSQAQQSRGTPGHRLRTFRVREAIFRIGIQVRSDVVRGNDPVSRGAER